MGVVLAASTLTALAWLRAGYGAQVMPSDFSLAFVLAALLATLSVAPFIRLGGVHDANLRELAEAESVGPAE